VAPQILERSWFSARVADVRLLDRMARVCTNLTSPTAARAAGERLLNRAYARQALRDELRAMGWEPTAQGVTPGSLQDLTSDGRLNLILDTNTALARGYGQWAAGQDPDVLDTWPAQELIREVDPEGEPRNWAARWQEAGGILLEGGRMVALKNDPIWEGISAFGLPYPPFDYNSGMGLRDVGYREALDLGLLEPGQRVDPTPTGFDQDVRAAAPESPGLQRELEEAFGDRLEVRDGVLVLRGPTTAARLAERARRKGPLPVEAQKNIIGDLVADALARPSVNRGEDFGAVSTKAVAKAQDATGIDLSGYTKRIEAQFVRHSLHEHGDAESEAARGQEPITEEDLMLLPQLMDSPEIVEIGSETGPRDELRLVFKSRTRGGHHLVLELRAGRKRLVPITIRKGKLAGP
jgi:hypothetical protein